MEIYNYIERNKTDCNLIEMKLWFRFEKKKQSKQTFFENIGNSHFTLVQCNTWNNVVISCFIFFLYKKSRKRWLIKEKCWNYYSTSIQNLKKKAVIKHIYFAEWFENSFFCRTKNTTLMAYINVSFNYLISIQNQINLQ